MLFVTGMVCAFFVAVLEHRSLVITRLFAIINIIMFNYGGRQCIYYSLSFQIHKGYANKKENEKNVSGKRG